MSTTIKTIAFIFNDDESTEDVDVSLSATINHNVDFGEPEFLEFLEKLEEKNNIIIEVCGTEEPFIEDEESDGDGNRKESEGLVIFDIVDYLDCTDDDIQQLTSRVHNDLVDFMRRPHGPSGE